MRWEGGVGSSAVAVAAILFALSFLGGIRGSAAADPEAWLPSPPGSPLGRDYLYPWEASLALGGGGAVVAEAGDGALVPYHSFYFGEDFMMRQYLGLYVRVLIKEDDLAKAGVGRIRDLVDRYDLLYALYAEITGGEPAGDGLLTIAFVRSCGGGCGFIGAKGIELAPQSLVPTSAYGPDGPYVYAVHEMDHNFDRISGYAMAGVDKGHQWTCFMDRYIRVYGREGVEGATPERTHDRWIENDYRTYIADPGATWERCVRDNDCPKLLCPQAGVLEQLAREVGPSGMRRGLAALRQWIAARDLNAEMMTELQRNDLMIEAMAYGAQADLSCYYDMVRWPVSTALRTAMASQYAAAVGCADTDGDSYSRFEDDCDDTDAALHPKAAEVQNGIDDDCDLLTDEHNLVESTDFPAYRLFSPGVRLPAVIRGNITSRDTDAFHFDLPAPAQVTVEFRSKGGFDGFFTLLEQGSDAWKASLSTNDSGRQSRLILPLGAGRWDTYVSTSSKTGGYEAILYADEPWPRVFVPPVAAGDAATGFTLYAPPPPPWLAPLVADGARFWLSNVGWVGAIVPSPAMTLPFKWYPAQSDVRANTRYRVQYRDGDVPASPPSSTTALDPACGNGLLDLGEQCDDGASIAGDGCSATCQTETCFACAGEPSACSPIITCAGNDGCCPSGCNFGNDNDCATPTPTDTSTSTPTRTPTNTRTFTSTPSATRTSTATPSRTSTRTSTSTRTATPTRTATATRTATPTRTETRTPTITPTPTKTPTPTATFTATATPSPTNTRTATRTNTRTATRTATKTASPTHTASQTRSATVTRTPTPTHSATVSPSPTGTLTVTPSITRTAPATRTATRTFTKSPAPTPTPTQIRTPTALPQPTITPTPPRTPSPPALCSGDCDADGDVDDADITVIVRRIARCTGSATGPCPGASRTCARGDRNGDGILSAADLTAAIAQSRGGCR